jgi:hypothetical protein
MGNMGNLKELIMRRWCAGKGIILVLPWVLVLATGCGRPSSVMHAGDTITGHQYVTPAADDMHITIADLTTGHSGTIILDSSDGPLMPAFDRQQSSRSATHSAGA